MTSRRALLLGLGAVCACAAPARAYRGFAPVDPDAVRGAARPAIVAQAPPADSAPPHPDPASAPAPPPARGSDPLFELASDEDHAGFPDPYQRTNRALLWLDQELARWVVDPITGVYQFVVPGPVRRAVRRFFLNLDTPALLVNDLLQREWADAGVTIERFALNTVFGIGGLFDPAAQLGLPRHSSDFGQTLALAGVGSGPYIILPFFGPSTVRDAFGGLVDLALQPTLYILPFGTLIIYESSLGLSARDAHSEALEMLRESSIDYYAALHNAYSQNRRAQIWSRREPHRRPAPPGGEGADASRGHAGSSASTAD
jgi:phospholipid-binding lipoprotein MlaA